MVVGEFNKDSKIFIAGHTGLVGSALLRALVAGGYRNIIKRERKELDLENTEAVKGFFERERPEFVFMAAAKVGGIMANNTKPAEFIHSNLLVGQNIVHQAYLSGVKKLLFLGSSCIYPRLSPQPIKEEYFMTGPLEPTNEAYAIAKIAIIKMCQAYNRQYGTNFISAMPTNQYGPYDNFDLESSHVLPGLLHRFMLAKENNSPKVQVWGTGKTQREFMYVDDLAEALIFLMQYYDSSEIINVGTGKDMTIGELVEIVKKITGFTGGVEFDETKPDGMPRKCLDVSKLTNFGWTAKTDLVTGIEKTYAWINEQTVKPKGF